VSLDEHPAQIIRNAQTLGLNLEEQIADGTIQIMSKVLKSWILMHTMHVLSNSSKSVTYNEW